jgi:polyhydroxybutyrate depolymerase
LELSRARGFSLAAVLVVLSACSGSAPDPTLAAPSTVASSAAPTTTVAPRPPSSLGTIAPTPASPTQTTVAVPPATPPATPCDHTNGMLTTPSGRHILLRAGALSGPSPLIVAIHGYTGTAAGIETYAELTEPARAAGIAVAYPEGTPTSAGGLGWNSGAGLFATTGVDDVAAVQEMLDTVIATGCVDPANMILTGESNGGGMALVAACADGLSQRFRQVVMINPAVDAAVLAHCTASLPPVPLTAVAGRRDQTVPYDGGRPPLLAQPVWYEQAAALVNRCAGLDPAAPLDAHVARTAGHACAACTELLTIDDGTHTWPGTSRGVAGLAPGSFDLNRLLLDRALAPGATGCLSGR